MWCEIWCMATKVSEESVAFYLQNMGLPEYPASYLIFLTNLILQTILSCFDTDGFIKPWQSGFILMDIELSLYINDLIKMTVVSTSMGYSDYILCCLSFVPNRKSVGECCGLSCVSTATKCTEVWFYPFKAKSSIRMKCQPSLNYFHYSQQFTHTFSSKK